MIPVVTLQPVRNKAYVTYGLIALNGLIFLWQLTLSNVQLAEAYYNLSVVPCEIGRNFVSPDTALDLLRSMFLHGSWLHLVGNMTFLWIFGRNVEDYLGHRKFLLLYVLWGIVAALTQVVVSSGSCVPMIGASGAIAGVLGSFLLFYPGTRVRVMVIFFRFFPRFYDIPALFVLGLWFILQLVDGFAALNVNVVGAGGGVAFFAHIGGFLTGLVVAFIYTMFHAPPPRVTYVD